MRSSRNSSRSSSANLTLGTASSSVVPAKAGTQGGPYRISGRDPRFCGGGEEGKREPSV
jgi:hypothetical protein